MVCSARFAIANQQSRKLYDQLEYDIPVSVQCHHSRQQDITDATHDSSMTTHAKS